MLEAAKLLGKDYTRIAMIVNTKTRGQVAKQANDLFHKSGSGHATPDSEFIREYFAPKRPLNSALDPPSLPEGHRTFVAGLREHGKQWTKLA